MLGGASAVRAHNVTVFAWVSGDTVFVESRFSGGRKPVGAPLEVYDSADNLLLKGVTDDQGTFSFPAPRKTEMKIVLHAGMGHKAQWTIPVEEFKDLPPGEKGSTKGHRGANHTHVNAERATDSGSEMAAQRKSTAQPTASADDIQLAIETALDKKLQPVLDRLAASRQPGADLRDIIGGIGYIIGLMGLVAYLRYRRIKK